MKIKREQLGIALLLSGWALSMTGGVVAFGFDHPRAGWNFVAFGFAVCVVGVLVHLVVYFTPARGGEEPGDRE